MREDSEFAQQLGEPTIIEMLFMVYEERPPPREGDAVGGRAAGST